MKSIAAIAAVTLGLHACATPFAHAAEKVKAGAASAPGVSVHEGVYVGATGGYATAALSSADTDLAAEGLFGGIVVGGGVITPSGMYLGLEADGVARNIRGSTDEQGVQIKATNDWLASVRGRVGVTAGPALLYATAGPAITQSKLATEGLGSDSEYLLGIAGGAGAELYVAPNLALGVEVIHYRFEPEILSVGGIPAEVDQSETVGRARLTFKLN